MNAAREAGVTRMVVNGSCEDDWPQVLALAKQFPEVLPSFGLHPWYVPDRGKDWLTTLEQHLDVIPSAVGEIGLDRWKPGLIYDGQEEAFIAQLELAAKRNLPVSIHCLKTWGRLLEILQAKTRPARGFLLHSYGGSVEMVQCFAELGAYFSFPGYYLHERKQNQRQTFRQIPLDRLLIETDAPDQLLPDSLNEHLLTDAEGNPLNHPANLPSVYRELASLRGISIVRLTEEMERNFSRLFQL